MPAYKDKAKGTWYASFYYEDWTGKKVKKMFPRRLPTEAVFPSVPVVPTTYGWNERREESEMSGLSGSELLFYGGISVMLLAVAAAILAAVLFAISGRRLRRKLEKEFTNDGPGIALMSLLPLEEKSLRLDMIGYLPGELKAVEVSYVLSGKMEEDDLVVWAKGSGSDNYAIVDQEATIDLAPESSYTSTVYLEMIVGTDDQLDVNNIRYNVRVYVTPYHDLLTVTAYTTGEARQPIDVYDIYLWERSNNPTILEIGVDANDWASGEMAYLSLGLSEEFDSTQFTSTVYKGLYDSEEEAVAANAAVIDDIWEQENIATEGGHLGDYGYKRGYQGMTEVTVVLKRGDAVAMVCPVILYMYEEAMHLSWDGVYVENNGSYKYIDNGSSSQWDYTLGMQVSTIELDSGYPANGTYYLRMRMDNPADTSYTTGVEYVQHAAVGDFDTAAAIQAQPDIKDLLFSDSTGYPADYSSGVIFSVLDINGDIYQRKIVTEAAAEDTELPAAPRPDSQDTYFRMESAQAVTENGTGNLSYYVMPYEHDGYYYNGYQTVFLLNTDGTPVAAEKIVPEFFTGNKVTMYAGLDHASGTEQKSGETAIEFRDGETIQYSAAAESAGHLKNYWVTFVTQQTGGPSLFVNAANDPDRVDEESGLPVREVFLTDEYDYHHDVFFANMGDQEMTGIYVKLENAENVALDEYWTVREDAPDANRTLAAFTTTEKKDASGDWVYYGELPNVAKVRLVPTKDSVGIISGTLVIGYEGGEEVRIKLTGTSGTPKITTDTIVDGVKYVPYNSVIQTNSMGASDAIVFQVTSGSLPTGVTLQPNGKLYGMPTRAGDYTFTVTSTYNNDPELSDSKTFTITIKNNTNDNVDAATDPGYTVLDRVPDTMTTYEDQVFRSEGTYSYFYKFYLDGRELTEGQDFDSEEGSTKITVRAQTFQNAGSGTHTIAAEFRTDKSDTNTVKRAAQNYTVPGGGSSSSKNTLTFETNGGSALSAISGSNGTTIDLSKYVPTRPGYIFAGWYSDKDLTMAVSQVKLLKDATVYAKWTEETIGTNMPFRDVSEHAYYADAVVWAAEEGITSGKSATLFGPDDICTRAQAVTFLWRAAGSPAANITEMPYEDVAADAYYYNAVLWTVENNVICGTSNTMFNPDMTCSRAHIVTFLWRAHKSPAADVENPFADVEGDAYYADAVLWAVENGITAGTGDDTFSPDADCTRAQIVMFLFRAKAE